MDFNQIKQYFQYAQKKYQQEKDNDIISEQTYFKKYLVISRLMAQYTIDEYNKACDEYNKLRRMKKRFKYQGVSITTLDTQIAVSSDICKKIKALLASFGGMICINLDGWQCFGATYEDLYNFCCCSEKTISDMKKDINDGTVLFSDLVCIHYPDDKNKQEEARQEIKDTADKTKELTDNINTLYKAYSDMQTGVENGTESKENLTTATNDLLEALGYEGEAVDKLIEKYGTLDDAINQTTADTLKNSLPDLADAVDVELTELIDNAFGHDDALHFGFDITADDTESKELLNFIKEYDNNNGGVEFAVIDSLTTRIDFEGDRNSAEGIKERLDNMKALRQSLFENYGAENVQNLDFYEKLSKRITELETAYKEYNTAVSSYNDTAAQAEIIQSLIGKEIPKTVNEYKSYRRELIMTAQNSGQFIGSQEDITNAIDGTLSKMSEFADIRERTNNLDTAYRMFGIDDVVNDANEGTQKAFINSLSDEDLAILIQLDRSVFDKGIDGARQAIEDFNNDPDNDIVSEADTSGLEELQKAYEETTKSADSFIKNQKSLKSALEEQEKYGQLSADEQIAQLEEQKEILETQRDNSKDYYDKVVEDLESQKEAREKQYDILVGIYEQLGGEKKQTSLNESLVSKLTKNGDINKAVQGLTPTELQKAFTSGILTTDGDGNYAIDYSILGENNNAINKNTAELEKLNNQLSGETNTDISKVDMTKPHLDAEGYLVGTNGKRVLHDGNGIKATTKTEWEKKKTPFAGYATMHDLTTAMMNGSFNLPNSWSYANQTMNSNIMNGIGKDIKQVPEYIYNNVTNNNAPNINFYNTIQGDVNNDTVRRFEESCKHTVTNEIKSVLNEITQKIKTTPYR